MKDPRNIWLIGDDRPGHKSQLRGLGARLRAHSGAKLHWIEARPVSLVDIALGRLPTDLGPPPDIAIGAGHGTHRMLIAAGRAHRCMTVVLMRPTMPLWFFSAAIIPAHDSPERRPATLVTQGALNAITPHDDATRDGNVGRGLVLIGGPSDHFAWDGDSIVDQVSRLIAARPDVEWTAADSRRTPAGTLSRIADFAVATAPHTETPPGWVAQALSQSGQAWVTPDSVSMVYEALTANLATGVFVLPSRATRVARGVSALVASGELTEFPDLPTGPPKARLWEADRAARWLLERYAAISGPSAR